MSGADTEDVLRRLVEICGADFARPAGAADEVAGAPTGFVAAPPGAEGVGEVLRLAGERDLTVVPRGAGTKIDWGFPSSHVDIVLDAGRLAGWHHPAADDVVEVGAGTPVRSLRSALAQTGQRIPIDVPSADATIGGMVAADEAGPLRLRHGLPGDRLVAVSYVNGLGELIRADARSRAPVPGVDPVRFLGGSQGALGVLVSAAFRVQPVPACRLWALHPLRDSFELKGLLHAIASLADPVAIEVDLPGSRTGYSPGPDIGTVASLLEGEDEEVAGRVAALLAATGKDAQTATRPPGWWSRYPFQPGEVALRVEVPRDNVPNAILALRDGLRMRPAVRGSAGLGVLHCALPGGMSVDEVQKFVRAVESVLLPREGRCRVITAPPALRQVIDPWGDPSDESRLRRLKERLDPGRRLAPGRLVGGI